MSTILSRRSAAAAALFGGAAILTLRAEAAGPEADDLFAMPFALFRSLEQLALYILAPALVLGAIAHRPLIAALHRRLPRLLARIEALRDRLSRRLSPPAPVTPAAATFSESAELAAAIKARMTEVHARLRRIAPEMLPGFAEYRAAQSRLLAEAANTPAAMACARPTLLGGLAQIEAATEKLSVVLDDATKEYALGNYTDTLEKLTGAAMECLCGVRARARLGADPGVSLAGETGTL